LDASPPWLLRFLAEVDKKEAEYQRERKKKPKPGPKPK
jgi:hypothetical protein